MLYLISAVLFIIALTILILAPRNLWDNLIAMAAIIVLFFAVLQDKNFADHGFVVFLFYILNRTTTYIAPLLSGIFGIGMLFQSIHLYRYEQNRLQYLIGQFLGLLLIGMTALHYYIIFFVELSEQQNWIRVPEFVMAYYVLLFINFLINTVRLTAFEDESKQEYMIILGESVREDGKPSETLQERMNTALKYIERQRFLHGTIPKIIVSGGATQPNSPTEARIMADYLIDHDINKGDIFLDDKAMNTHQNFVYSKAIIESHQRIVQTISAVFVTSGYHLYRSQLYANMEGLYQVSGVGSPTPLVDRLFGLVREYIAVLFMHRKLHLSVSFLIIGFGIINYVHF